ncbi:sorting nexin-16-like isoform X2 [Carassius carassius]|uniref:sorting nexin-16-like isoform X2 n=1 Tax=Carassius carassius TaxID=217509 RepID=UPI00286857E7|nr:sorting nexin-16-like isoform X2 [Carassius carassius]
MTSQLANRRRLINPCSKSCRRGRDFSEHRRSSMFYQNLSPDVVRRGNAMEYYSNGFCRERSEERTLKVTLLGYKVMEEKTKFTVYKILVKRAPEESWHIFRRYTDFSRLHDKLKEAFPSFNFTLPPKRWFKNFSAEFLEERQLGLQNFLQNLIAHKDVRISEAVREFLRLDDPPTAFDDIREKWAFCETPGGTNGCLQRDLMDEERETESLRNVLLHKELLISQPERTKNGMYRTQEKLNREPRDVLTAQEYKEVERDALRRPNKCSELGFIRTHGACWCGSANKSPEKHSSKKPIK